MKGVIGRFFHSPVYPTIRRIECRQPVVRVDNRSPERLVIDKGLPARVTHEHMRNLSRCVDNDQSYNITLFGYGACFTYETLDKDFIQPNARHFENAHVYSLIGHGFSIPEYRAEIGELGARDYEGEFLITYKVELQDFLAAVAANYREKFKRNLLVPNEGILLNPELPTRLRLSDIESPASTLQWLLKHNAKKTATRYAKQVFTGKSDSFLEKTLDDKDLIVFVSETAGLKLINLNTEVNTSSNSSLHKI